MPHKSIARFSEPVSQPVSQTVRSSALVTPISRLVIPTPRTVTHTETASRENTYKVAWPVRGIRTKVAQGDGVSEQEIDTDVSIVHGRGGARSADASTAAFRSRARAFCLSSHGLPPLCLQHGSIGEPGLYGSTAQLRSTGVDERPSERESSARMRHSFAAASRAVAVAKLALGHGASRWCPCAL